MQSRYLKRIGMMVALGLGAGLSAAAWQENFSLPFYLAFLSMLAGGGTFAEVDVPGFEDFELRKFSRCQVEIL
jgi:peptidoglycan biosynthesis protein MviN/MurJ (putative lipid II flippase)